MSHRIAASLIVLAVAAAAAAAEPPVVIAIDTSRSISSAELQTLGGALARVLAQLPDESSVGLLTFDDEASWRVRPTSGREQALAALPGMAPRGDHTVLYDALLLAAQELRGGGVVLLSSDGRDDGSATTADDVARACEAHHVRVITSPMGHRVDQRSLRRLALISRGDLVGPLARDPTAAAAALARARDGVSAELEELAPPPAATPAPAPPARQEARASRSAWLFPLLALLGVGLAVAVWLATRRKRTDTRSCDRCGAPLELWETNCSRCQIRDLEEAARTQQVAPAVTAASEEIALDPEVFKKSPLPQGLEHTLVLDEQPVLIARQRGRSARSYALPKDQVFAVGRAPQVNSLQVDDPTVSAQHFRIVPKEGEFYVVDLETTNGTLVNHERVRVRKLASGDVIQVGAVQFEFSLQLKRLG